MLSDNDQKQLVKSLLPLEVLIAQIKDKPYNEMTTDFQQEIVESVESIRDFVLKGKLLEKNSEIG